MIVCDLSSATFYIVTALKRSLGQGNIFTGVPVILFTGRGDLCIILFPVSLPGPMFLPGVSVQGVSVQGGFCPGESLSWRTPVR